MSDYSKLIDAAKAAREHAYAPYSHFRVGAALLTKNGQIYTGCNIENASFSATNCAERTAFFKAVSNGETAFEAIAIISDSSDYVAPCGVCRQVMIEFCKPEFVIIMCKADGMYEQATLAELMPASFNPSSLQ